MSAAPFRAVLFGLFVTGCVTGGPKDSGPLPADAAPLFRGCAPGDGGIALNARRGDTPLGSVELEWIAKPGSLDIELTGPLGETQLSVKVRDNGEGKSVALAGPLRTRVPPVEILPSGYLQVDGHFVGIRANELACLFQAALPRAWPSKFVYSQKGGEGLRLVFEDADRDMTVTFPSGAFLKSGPFCAQVSWSSLVVLTRSLTWCVGTLSGVPSGSFSGLSDYNLEWKALDEQSP